MRGRPTIRKLSVLGSRLRVASWNDDAPGDDLPLLVFSGIGMNLELLEPIAKALAPRRVISFDMPGIGQSPDPLVPYSMLSMAMTTSIVLDRLEIERVDVLGISWGGSIAQQFALQHRPRVGCLILAATAAGVLMVPGNAKAMARFTNPREFTVGNAIRRTLALMYNGGGAGIPVSLNAASPPSPVGWLCQVGAMFGWSSLPLLPLLDVPTLIIAGEEDNVVPPVNSRLLHAMIPGSRLRLVQGGGHLFMLSHLDRFATEIDGFLAMKTPVESA